jgi:hypothetical protein
MYPRRSLSNRVSQIQAIQNKIILANPCSAVSFLNACERVNLCLHFSRMNELFALILTLNQITGDSLNRNLILESAGRNLALLR